MKMNQTKTDKIISLALTSFVTLGILFLYDKSMVTEVEEMPADVVFSIEETEGSYTAFIESDEGETLKFTTYDYKAFEDIQDSHAVLIKTVKKDKKTGEIEKIEYEMKNWESKIGGEQ